jgi:hypothetical protein
MEVCRVLPAHVEPLWPLVRDYIRAAMRHGYDEFYAESDIRRDCASGNAQLWVACDAEGIAAALVSRIAAYPKRRICQVPLIGGRDMRRWLEPMQTLIEDFAREHGCTHMEGGGRSGWCRVAGYQNIGPVLMKELTR